jgi:hypothetical protein
MYINLEITKVANLAMSENAKGLIAVLLRNVIRNWIQDYEVEFAGLWVNPANLVENVELLVTLMSENSDSHRKKAIYWPALTAIFLISAGDAFEFIQYYSTKKKKSIFSNLFEGIRKAYKSKSSVDVSFFCYNDILRAATAVQTANINTSDNMGVAIFCTLLDNLDMDFKERYFDLAKPTIPTKDVDSYFNDDVMCDFVSTKVEYDDNAKEMIHLILNEGPMQYKNYVVFALKNIHINFSFADEGSKALLSTFDTNLNIDLRLLFLVYLCLFRIAL